MVLIPIVPCEEEPKDFRFEKEAEKVQRLDLRQLELGSFIEFSGVHPGSNYIVLLIGSENDRRIKLWLKGYSQNGVTGTIDDLISINPEGLHTERGVLEVKKNYILPTFYHDRNGFVFPSHQDDRCEPYTAIFLKRPFP